MTYHMIKLRDLERQCRRTAGSPAEVSMGLRIAKQLGDILDEMEVQAQTEHKLRQQLFQNGGAR